MPDTSAFPAVFERLKRMQGKSCFNFRAVDEARFGELEAIIAKGFKRWVAAGFVAEQTK